MTLTATAAITTIFGLPPDVINAYSTFAMAVFSFFLLFSVVFAGYQLYQTERWNKLNAVHAYYPVEKITGIFRSLIDLYKVSGVIANGTGAISEESIQKVLANDNLLSATNDLLSLYEEYALAIKYKVLNEQYVYDFRYPETIELYNIILPYIKKRQTEPGNEHALEEFVALGKRWVERRENEKIEGVLKRCKRGFLPKIPDKFWILIESTNKAQVIMQPRTGSYSVQAFIYKRDAEALGNHRNCALREVLRKELRALLEEVKKSYVMKDLRLDIIKSVTIDDPRSGGTVTIQRV